MVKDTLPVGYIVSEDEIEAIGIDDQPALERAQRIYSGAAH